MILDIEDKLVGNIYDIPQSILDNPQNILDISPRKSMECFFNDIDKYKSIDKKNLKDLADRLIRGDDDYPLKTQWYDSLQKGDPDYSVYGDNQYISEAWACWAMYSRKYLKNICSPKSLPPDGIVARIGPIKKILDAGCGFGYTTAALKQIFPDAEIIGTNIPGTFQYVFASRMAQLYDFKIVGDSNEVGNVDLVFASEYFEHFYAPIEHLKHIVTSVHPRVMLIANTFGSESVGHFRRYKIGTRIIRGKKASVMFNKTMRHNHFTNIKTKLWNNKPRLWVKDRGH